MLVANHSVYVKRGSSCVHMHSIFSHVDKPSDQYRGSMYVWGVFSLGQLSH